MRKQHGAVALLAPGETVTGRALQALTPFPHAQCSPSSNCRGLVEVFIKKINLAYIEIVFLKLLFLKQSYDVQQKKQKNPRCHFPHFLSYFIAFL